MEPIASLCSWSWVNVLLIRWCPVCCRDMFHKDLSIATESAAPCQPREKWCTSQKQRKVIFDLPRQLSPKVGTWPLQTTPHPPARRAGLVLSCGCPRGSNKSNWTVHQWHFRKSEASFPCLVKTVSLLLAIVFGSYWNFRPWRNSQPHELVMGFWQRAIR